MINRIRIQPKAIEVPDDDPFKHDLLGRRAFAETLAATLGAIDGPGVFAIDGGWGTGKTTFVAMFSQHLRNDHFRVVNINAWETDYGDDPLSALVSSLADAEEDATRKDSFKRTALGLLKVVAPPAIRIATSGLLNLDAAFEKGAGDVLAKFAENGLARFEEHAKSMAAFKERLAELADDDGHKPLVVIVDELDRCRPTYAVEMLETIKHAFDVDKLIFVLAVNRQQLDQSAAVLYGTSSDPESYFRRFFDVESRLPDADRAAVVRTLLRGLEADTDRPSVDLLANVLAASPYSIRVMNGLLRHYAVVTSALTPYKPDVWSWLLPVTVLLRQALGPGYHDFIAGRSSDERLIAGFFDLPWAAVLRGTRSGNMIEAAVIAVAAHRHHHEVGNGLGSALLPRYQADPESPHATEVVHFVAMLAKTMNLYGSALKVVSDRLETFDLSGLKPTAGQQLR